MSSRGEKRSGRLAWGRKKKKSNAFKQSLRIPRKSPSNASEDGEEGYSFGNMMYMMMIQSHTDNKHREQQYKNESEQRECEYQLCCEEMAVKANDESNDHGNVE